MGGKPLRWVKIRNDYWIKQVNYHIISQVKEDER